MDSQESKHNTVAFETKKNDSSEKVNNNNETAVSRSQSIKSHNTTSSKSMKISSANNTYNQQQMHEPRMEKLQSGAQVTIGNHLIEVVSYLTEGGFAHIYKVKFIKYLTPTENMVLKKDDIICLKRVIVQNQQGLNELQMEVDTMKKLINCDRIVTYYDSVAIKKSLFDGSEIVEGDLESGSMFDPSCYYEVLVIMELCPNNSLLDFMNERLVNKLSELEILTIMYDITKALYFMHASGMIHKDIKIENVLVDKNWRFKLCDFGSTSRPYPIVTTPQEIAFLSQDIYVHTTPQYRSPEMIDLYRSLPIDEKSDIWALGIFLYKLIFYTTPFEMTGQFAILHSRYDIPANKYSPNLSNLIVIMLSENPSLRPNIYQVFLEIHSMLKGNSKPISSSIVDIYQLGPYNFNKYASYQSYLQNLQYQMVTSYQQKKLIDDYMYLNVFEIAPKQPYNPGVNPANQPFKNNNNNTTKNPYLENALLEPVPVVHDNSSKSQEFKSSNNNNNNNNTIINKNPYKQNNSSDSKLSGTEVEKKQISKVSDEQFFNVSPEKGIASPDEFAIDTIHVEDAGTHIDEDISKRFPAVDDLALELGQISDSGFKKIDASKSSGSSKSLVKSEENVIIRKLNSNDNLSSSLDKTTKISQNYIPENKNIFIEAPVKKYKSNNPFPKMASSSNTSNHKKPVFPINDHFYSPSKQSAQPQPEMYSTDVSTNSYNNQMNNFLTMHGEANHSLNSPTMQSSNTNSNKKVSPFLTASIPSRVLSATPNGQLDQIKGQVSNSTKDLIDFSDIDIDSTVLASKTNSNQVNSKSMLNIGDLKKKFKEESPMLSGDDSINDSSDMSIKMEESTRDSRIKNLLQLRYTDIDLESPKEEKGSQVLKPKPSQPEPYIKQNNTNEINQPVRKSLDLRRHIFTEDIDLNNSQESLSPAPERETYSKKHKLLHHHHQHSHTTSTNGGTDGSSSSSSSNTPINKTRRSLEFEREVMKASRTSVSRERAIEEDYDDDGGDKYNDDGIGKSERKSLENKNKKKDSKTDRSNSSSKQEKRKSLFGKFTKGF